MEYIPKDFDINNISSNIEFEEPNAEISYSDVVNNETMISANINNPSESTVEAILPRTYYWGYAAKAETNKLEVHESEDGKVEVTIPANFSGKITAYYKPVASWNISNIITFAASLILIIYVIRMKRREQIS